ncbi:MAG: hypothetical protein GC161_06590 [Planctomycetaceae bacterium]|nr:hypothetical protein [Planctomycetaceae bacterium]
MVLAQLLMASALSLSQGDAAPQTIETGATVFGVQSCWTGDWNGDGRRDIAVAEPWRSDTPDFLGRVEVFCGVTGAVLHTFEGAKNAPQLGRALVGVPDVDGDGIDDVLAAALGTLPVERREPRALFEPEPRAFDLVLLGSRGEVVQTVAYPDPQADEVEMRAVAVPTAPPGTPGCVGLLVAVTRRDKSAAASWGLPFAGERFEPVWRQQLASRGSESGRLFAVLAGGDRCLLTVLGHEGPRVIAVERETGKEVLRLEPPAGSGRSFGSAIAYLHVEGDTAGRIVVAAPAHCTRKHGKGLTEDVGGEGVPEQEPHGTVLWYRADDGTLVAQMCDSEFARHVQVLAPGRGFDPSHQLGNQLEALRRPSGGERESDLLVVTDGLYGDGVALVLDSKAMKPLVVAPASIDYVGWFDDWGRAWSLAVEPTDGTEPPRLLLGTKSPYGGTHSGVLVCSSTTGELLLRVVRAAPILTPAPSGG